MYVQAHPNALVEDVSVYAVAAPASWTILFTTTVLAVAVPTSVLQLAGDDSMSTLNLKKRGKRKK
jgi:hypothetical protein